jgi:hypothetical protein
MRDLVSALVRQRPGFVVVPNVVDIPQIAGSKHPTTIRIRGGCALTDLLSLLLVCHACGVMEGEDRMRANS